MEQNSDYLTFKSVTEINKPLILNELESNLKLWLDWCFLSVGGWVDVNVPQSGVYGGNFHILNLSTEAGFTQGRAWETPRNEMVYETGVNYDGSGNPIVPTGVYINNNFYASNDATYGHYVDYPRGRVVFDTAIPTTSVVSMNYSYRSVQVQTADNSDVWTNIQYNSFNVESTSLTNSETGDWTAINSAARRQLPAIIIEGVPVGEGFPYELGNGSLKIRQDVMFYGIAEDRYTRNQLIDIIRLQQDKTIYMFNTDEVSKANVYPLSYDGSKNPTGLCYKDLVKDRGSGGYRWRSLKFVRMRASEMQTVNPSLHMGAVRATVEIVYGTA